MSFGFILVGFALGGGKPSRVSSNADQRPLDVQAPSGHSGEFPRTRRSHSSGRIGACRSDPDGTRTDLRRRSEDRPPEFRAWPAAPSRPPWRRKHRPQRAGPFQWRPTPSERAVPRRTAAALIVWPSGSSDSKHCPTSNNATSPKPRSALRCAAFSRPGSRLGRMSERSDAIGFASARRASPPPNSSASALPMNDQVMASTSPRTASARFAQAGALLDQRQDRLGHGCFEPRQRLRLDAVETDDADDLLDEIRLALDIGTPRRRRHIDRVAGALNCRSRAFRGCASILRAALADPDRRGTSDQGKSMTRSSRGTFPATTASLALTAADGRSPCWWRDRGPEA